MRKIQFRAFYDGGLYNVTELMWSNQTAYICEIGNEEECETIDLDKIELMEFTGLLDRNGKEIYEGDVVEFYPNYGHGKMAHGHIGYRDNDASYWIYLNKERTSFTGICNLYAGNTVTAQVIGNIYQDPRLFQ